MRMSCRGLDSSLTLDLSEVLWRVDIHRLGVNGGIRTSLLLVELVVDFDLVNDRLVMEGRHDGLVIGLVHIDGYWAVLLTGNVALRQEGTCDTNSKGTTIYKARQLGGLSYQMTLRANDYAAIPPKRDNSKPKA
jgi:hypothetical protein